MNDHGPEGIAVRQEILADPEHVVFCLLLKPHTRTHAGVNKKVITEPNAQMKAGQKMQMRWRQGPPQSPGGMPPLLE